MVRAALLTLLLSACSFDADYRDTAFQCDPSDGCPSGYTCESGTCVAGGGGDDDGGPALFYGEFIHRKRLTVAAGRVAADLESFPLLVVRHTDPELSAGARMDGDDIAFRGVDGEPLPHEIERWTPSSGQLVAWVLLPMLAADSDTELYLVYGADKADREAPHDLWGDYAGVWHMNGISIDDSTEHDLDGTAVGGVTADQEAVGPAIGLDDGYVTFGDQAPLQFDATESFTASAWVRLDEPTGDYRFLFGKGGGSAGTPGWGFETDDTTPGLAVCVTDADQARCTGYVTPPDDGVYGLLAMVVDRSAQELRMFIDGQSRTIQDGIEGIATENDDDFNLGASRTGTYRWPGAVDELRVSPRILGATRLRADHDNQLDPATFVEVGPEE